MNMAGRQISVQTNNSHSKDGQISSNHGNDPLDGHGNDVNDHHGHQEQMLEQLMQESRAMTGNSSQAWVENLNSKSTWSPSMQKKFGNNHCVEGSMEVERNSEDIFQATGDEFFKAQNSAPQELLSGKKLYATDNTVAGAFKEDEPSAIVESGRKDGTHSLNPRSPDKLKRQNAQQSVDDSDFGDALSEKRSAQTSEQTQPQFESESESATQSDNSQIQQGSLHRAKTESESAGAGEANLTWDSLQIAHGHRYSDSSSGTFKTSAFSKVTSIDSSEEVTEQTDLSPLDTRNSLADPSDLTSRTGVLCEGPTSFRQIDDPSKATIKN